MWVKPKLSLFLQGLCLWWRFSPVSVLRALRFVLGLDPTRVRFRTGAPHRCNTQVKVRRLLSARGAPRAPAPFVEKCVPCSFATSRRVRYANPDAEFTPCDFAVNVTLKSTYLSKLNILLTEGWRGRPRFTRRSPDGRESRVVRPCGAAVEPPHRGCRNPGPTWPGPRPQTRSVGTPCRPPAACSVFPTTRRSDGGSPSGPQRLQDRPAGPAEPFASLEVEQSPIRAATQLRHPPHPPTSDSPAVVLT